MRKVVVFGATSAIAQEMIHIFAARGDKLFLVARNEKHLNVVVEDAIARSGQLVGSLVKDLADVNSHASIWAAAETFLNGADTVVFAHGLLGDQKKAEVEFGEVERIFSVNALSTLSLLTLVGNQFEKNASGDIVVLSSPAAERGRRSNYIYGSAKAGLSVFTSGLRNRLFDHGVNVMTVYPGFVDTPMTRDFKKGPLWAKPNSVAEQIVDALDHKALVFYTPWYWRYIMIIIKLIPEFVFVKLNL